MARGSEPFPALDAGRRVSVAVASSIDNRMRSVSSPRTSTISARDGVRIVTPFTSVVRPSTYVTSRGRNSARNPVESTR
jgi:hypothetical protein